jgi:hypothetical protein
MLLKERKVADKRGKGMEALFHAESTMGGKTDMRAEIDEAWTDEKAAMMAVYEGSRLESTFASPEVNGGDLTFDERERERLLGSKGGKAVTSILKGDQKEVTGQCKVGIALWDVTRVPGVDRTPTAIFSGSRTHRIFGLLHKAVERGGKHDCSSTLHGQFNFHQ